MLNLIKDDERKDWFLILKEMSQLLIKDKTLPVHYFTKFLYRKNVANINNYLSFKNEGIIMKNCYRSTPDFVDRIASDKLLFHLYTQKLSLNTPQLVGWTIGKENFINNQQEITKVSKTEMRELLRKAIKKHGSIFCKPFRGKGGTGCFSLSEDNIDKLKLSDLNHYIYEAEIKQHSKVNEIYPNSLNTIRIITFYNNDKLSIMAGLMRFGANNSKVDNASLGGMFVPIDIENKKLTQFGYSHLHHGGYKYSYHPDTKTTFNNFKIPYFNKTLQLINDSITLFPATLVGWDIGITESGPILVEVNSLPGLMAADISYGGLKSHPDFESLRNFVNNYGKEIKRQTVFNN
ncbi:sugar-transfer associated ATP-grasp domain-containing protein [Natranaerobius trueperi]|uniref:Alpha-L-glutamate ligase-related protein ATP-grasp domain-containing protein n=1 Tax=Natranaerobius trueperi TaxID=759412 RepID=A0A226C3H0_9FIRM|nr:sugar-transfer associated ATP-grasp domain-containing protein [Natranaerobius trueperi]OWZ84977.1 hypothetical protein CDO51_00815 [Natranaerobius trueperi]